MQLTKTETGTTKISLYSISSCIRAKSLTNYFEINDLFTWGYLFLVPNFQDSLSPISPFSLHALSTHGQQRLQGFLPQPDELYFTTDEKNFFLEFWENCNF
jgi:hypothetical protein